MSLERLTEQELNAIHNPADIFYLEIVKDYDKQGRLSDFDVYTPTNLKHYAEKQKEWLEDDRWYLGKKLDHNPTEAEFMEDYCEKTHNAQRFRLFYELKYPTMIKRDGRRKWL